jgi:hypothetical protein
MKKFFSKHKDYLGELSSSFLGGVAVGVVFFFIKDFIIPMF